MICTLRITGAVSTNVILIPFPMKADQSTLLEVRLRAAPSARADVKAFDAVRATGTLEDHEDTLYEYFTKKCGIG